MAVIKGIVKKGQYFDSVSLMMVAKKINESRTKVEVSVVMGTEENKSILKNIGLFISEFNNATETDLLVVAKVENENEVNEIIQEVEQHLSDLHKKNVSSTHFIPQSIESALEIMPDANMSMISIPGKYAGDQALQALKKGLHVMLFSDNVSLAEEIGLKKLAKEKGLLMMGPECGTAIINGTPLAFANVVKRGNIGVIAASGTGLQEVTTIMSNAGHGISQAIGTGGRDIKKEVGGIMFIEAMKMLAQDDHTKVILLISKPPDKEVLEKIGLVAMKIDKPLVSVFLGMDNELIRKYNIFPAKNLHDGAEAAVQFAQGFDHPFRSDDRERLQAKAKEEALKIAQGQTFIRALFTGGTFCLESQLIFEPFLEGIYSNVPVGSSHKLENSWESFKHTIIDFGVDEFTVGRPHPMIDFTIRNKRIKAEAEDPETAIILLDLVLGFGAHMDPISELLPVIKEAKQIAHNSGRYLPVVCSVTGTKLDPQNREKVVKQLKDAGVLVFKSNAEASKFCSYVISRLGVW